MHHVDHYFAIAKCIGLLYAYCGHKVYKLKIVIFYLLIYLLRAKNRTHRVMFIIGIHVFETALKFVTPLLFSVHARRISFRSNGSYRLDVFCVLKE
jgi:ascorbate-specific PTS system EIIC-type component UlaA